MTFEKFCKTIREGMASGAIKPPAQLSELELAIQYSIGREQEARGTVKITLTAEEIALLILKYCGPDVYARVLPQKPPERG